jgi:hypothetical protein
MAFIKFSNTSAESTWNEQRISLGRPETVLQGKDSPVHAIPEDVLDELDELQLPYVVLQERELVDVLSERGFDYYQMIKRQHPEVLYFDATLPPALCIEVSFQVQKDSCDLSIQILERLEGFEIRQSEPGATQRILVTPEQQPIDDLEDSQKIEIRAFLPAEHLETLVSELAAAQIAGYDRETQVLILQDPDRSAEA